MKINKLTLLAAITLSTLVSFNATAGKDNADKPGTEAKPGRPGGPGGGKIAEELNLTAEQKPKVAAVMKEAAEKRKALADDTTLSQDERREKMKAIAEATKAKMKEILTAEQLAKMEELRKNHPRGEGRPGQKKGDAAAK